MDSSSAAAAGGGGGGGGDMFASSTAPMTWHDFLERMRHPSAAEFVKSIKSFIVSFLNNAPDPERDSASVQEFLKTMEAAFRAHTLWAGSSEEELDSAGEGLEKYVMTKLFTRVFASVPDEVNIDEQLHEKMALIQQFIRPENLDIRPAYQNETSWVLAQKELRKINMYKAPRDKLVCILNCCKVISNLLMNAAVASNEGVPGADEFLPVLIYVTIKANPPQLHSNLLYIQRYRNQSRLVSESAYFFTNILSAESFILNIDATSLSMDENEFSANMASAQTLLYGLSADTADSEVSNQSSVHVPRLEPSEHKHKASKSTISLESFEAKSEDGGFSGKDHSLLHKVMSISDLENKGAAMIVKEEYVNKVFQEFPYLFSESGDLTVADVEELLNNYKQLVFKYVCLAKGLGVAVPSPPLAAAQIQGHTPNKDGKEAQLDDRGAAELSGESHDREDDGSNEVTSDDKDVDSGRLDDRGAAELNGERHDRVDGGVDGSDQIVTSGDGNHESVAHAEASNQSKESDESQ